MAPPNPLQIATSSLGRLVKEEASYHKELAGQHTRLQKLESSTADDEEGNREFRIKQEKTAIEETKAVFPPLRQRITDAIHKLEDQLEGGAGSEEEVKKAREIIESAKVAAKEH